MSPPIGLTYLTEVKPFKSSWRIRVKVLHVWRQYTAGSGETLDIVISDENGSKMHATVRKAYIARFQRFLKIGDWKIIEFFSLSPSSGKYRISNLSYRMSFTNKTVVFLNLADFGDVKNHKLDENILIDILGQIVAVGKVENLIAQNKPQKKLEFQIRDVNDERLSCTLWGKFGEKVFSHCQNVAPDEKTIVLIRFAKLHNFKGEISIRNAFDASDVVMNPLHYPEVEQFLIHLPSDGLCLTIQDGFMNREIVLSKKDNFVDYPWKTIADILQSVEVGKWRTIVTVFAIDVDWGWFYFSCRQCNRKAELEDHPDGKVVDLKNKPKFWCDTCLETVTNVEARYKLHVHVMDQTGDTKLMLFDSFASKIIGKTAMELLDGKFEEIDDPIIVHDAINNLCGKTFQFLASVEKDNISNGKDFYKVARVWLGSEITKTETDLDSETHFDPSSIASDDQARLMLTNSSDYDDASNSSLSTPSSKRTIDGITETSEQSSTTKKLCTRKMMETNLEDIKFGSNIWEIKDGPKNGETKEQSSQQKMIKINDGVQKNVKVSDPECVDVNKILKVKLERYND